MGCEILSSVFLKTQEKMSGGTKYRRRRWKEVQTSLVTRNSWHPVSVKNGVLSPLLCTDCFLHKSALKMVSLIGRCLFVVKKKSCSLPEIMREPLLSQSINQQSFSPFRKKNPSRTNNFSNFSFQMTLVKYCAWLCQYALIKVDLPIKDCKTFKPLKKVMLLVGF